MNKKNYISSAIKSANIQIGELKKVKKIFNKSFIKAVDLILNCKGKIIFAGIGKSGLIARKISATFSSVGIPSFFCDPAQALHGDMGQMMATGMIGQIISAFLMLLILQNTSVSSYWGKVRFITLVGVSIGFISHYTYWNWFEFATPYILLTILDSLIGWFLAGLVMAKFHEHRNIESV